MDNTLWLQDLQRIQQFESPTNIRPSSLADTRVND